MGMRGFIRQVNPFELADFRRNPGKIKSLLDEDTLGSFQPAVRPAIERMQELLLHGQWNSPEVRQLDAQLREEMEKPGAHDLLFSNDEKRLSLEKCWHELHYLLTGTAGDAPPPLGNAILGGREIGVSLGYGPVRFLTPKEVREVAAALAEISNDELARRFDPAAIERADIYACSGEDGLEDDLYFFEQMVQYYTDAAGQGNGVLLYIR